MAIPRLIGLLNTLDPLVGTGGEDYTHGAVHPTLWNGGWPAMYDYWRVTHLWADLGVPRFCLYPAFGIYPSTALKLIGYDKSQAAVNSNTLGPRQAETDLADDRLVNGVASSNLPSFTIFWAGVVANFRSQGGEVMCWQGAPPFTTSQDAGTLDMWVAEGETCNMSLGLDLVARTDRLSYPTPSSALADRLALRNRRTYVGMHELLDVRVNGWADGRWQFASNKTRADLVNGTPANYNAPSQQEESVVFLTAQDIPNATTRCTTALQWIGRIVNGSPWTPAVELTGMTDTEIASLITAGAGG